MAAKSDVFLAPSLRDAPLVVLHTIAGRVFGQFHGGYKYERVADQAFIAECFGETATTQDVPSLRQKTYIRDTGEKPKVVGLAELSSKWHGL